MEQSWGGVRTGEMAYTSADWGGIVFCGIKIGEGEYASEIAGVGTEVEDFGEITVDILGRRSEIFIV